MLVLSNHSFLGLYLPPVLKHLLCPAPNDHFTAGPDCRVIHRAVGALVMLVAVQLFVSGLYLPPVFRRIVTPVHPTQSFRCQSIPTM